MKKVYVGMSASRRSILNNLQKILDSFILWRQVHLPTPETYFARQSLPKGDFEQRTSQPGEWIPYQCGEPDCPIPGGWHEVAGGMDRGRKDGVLWLEYWSVDRDGSTGDPVRWEEGDELSLFQRIMEANSYEAYYPGWIRYYLWVAENGQDPLKVWVPKFGTDNWFDFWLSVTLELVSSIWRIQK